MDRFKERVDDCRKNDLPDLIENAAWDHALYLFKSLLSVAAEKQEDVKIISGHLKNDFYGSLENEIENCINAGVKIDVFVLDDLSEDNTFAKQVNEYENGKVTPVNNKSIRAPHMVLIGDEGKRFRLETDHKQTKAVASFNNENMGRMLLTIYDQFIQDISCSQVEQPQMPAAC